MGIRKHFQYASYVLRHKWYVFVECCKLGIPFRGLIHDLSKLRLGEWFPYVEYFHGERPHKENYHVPGADVPFDTAWLGHIHGNFHHWQHWILIQDDGHLKALPMPEVYVLEMIADWVGAGKAQGKNDMPSWYDKNKDRIILNPKTRELVETLVNSYRKKK